MTNSITHIDVSINEDEEKALESLGFKKIDVDLNKGTQGKKIYLWYRSVYGAAPITRIQFSFDKFGHDLHKMGFTMIPKNINSGTLGDVIFLWFFHGTTEFDVPIVDMTVTTAAKQEPELFLDDWERVSCDLNRHVQGNWNFLWLKRKEKTYICDITATVSTNTAKEKIKGGYIRLDEDANRGAGDSYVFIWILQSTDSSRALTDLKISTDDDEYERYGRMEYKMVGVNLNTGTRGDAVTLWYDNKGKKPIKGVTLLCTEAAFKAYNIDGISLIDKNLNNEAGGRKVKLCFHQ